MYQYWLIHYNKCPILVQVVNNRRNCVWKELYGDFILCTQFFCNPKTVLKNKVRGTWVAQLVKHLPLAQVMIPGS